MSHKLSLDTNSLLLPLKRSDGPLDLPIRSLVGLHTVVFQR